MKQHLLSQARKPSGISSSLDRTVRRKAVGMEAVGPVPLAVGEALRSPGLPLEPSTRAFMETHLGHDFSQVRVHTDEQASASARSISAAAYTAGDHIAFSADKYKPASGEGRQLLAHELAHVAQQRQGSTAQSAAGITVVQDARSEEEARRTAGAVAAGGFAGQLTGVPRSAILRSPLSDDVAAGFSRGGKGEVFNMLRSRGPIKGDADLSAWLDRVFGPNTDPKTLTDDRWLADQIVAYGPEPLWPANALRDRDIRAGSHQWAKEPGNIEGTFGVGAGRPSVKAYYFPGTSGKRAMIIGGVHGTEASGVEVVNLLLEALRKPNAPPLYYTLVVVPVLFPENLVKGTRTTSPSSEDPNRNFPPVGTGLADARAAGAKAGQAGPVDSQGRLIEPENVVLIDLLERFQPERIASVHGHSPPPVKPRPDQDMPGIFVDPQSDVNVAKEEDKLTLAMAKAAEAKGVRVPGNRLGTKGQTTRYPPSAPKLSKGVSLGDWGPHAAGPRPAMTTITVEVFGNETIAKSKSPKARKVELESLAAVLRDVFLAPPAPASTPGSGTAPGTGPEQR